MFFPQVGVQITKKNPQLLVSFMNFTYLRHRVG